MYNRRRCKVTLKTVLDIRISTGTYHFRFCKAHCRFRNSEKLLCSYKRHAIEHSAVQEKSKAFAEEVLSPHTARAMTKNYSSSTLRVWRKSLNIVHSIVAPILFIWKQQYFKVIAVVNAACEKINGSFVSLRKLRKGYLERKKSIQDVLDRWSAHSSVGYALVVGFNAAVMLLMTTFAIEFAYHFRPYYWRIMVMIYSLTRLGLWLVFRQGMILMHNLFFLCFWPISVFFAGVRLTCLFLVLVASKASSAVSFVSWLFVSSLWLVFRQGMILMHNLIFLCFWPISVFFAGVRLTCLFLVLVASKASAAVSFVFWLFVSSASAVLNGFRVATSDSLPASALIRSNSQSPVRGVIALIVGAASFFLVILAWRRRKEAKLGFNSKNLTAGLYVMHAAINVMPEQRGRGTTG